MPSSSSCSDVAAGTGLVIEQDALPAGFYYYILQTGEGVAAKGKAVVH